MDSSQLQNIPINKRNKRGNPAWVKGVSGNPNGRKHKEDCLLSCIKSELEVLDKSGKTKEQMIATALVQRASDGDLKAIELVLEYTAVKPKAESSVELKGGFKVLWDGNRGLANATE